VTSGSPKCRRYILLVSRDAVTRVDTHFLRASALHRQLHIPQVICEMLTWRSLLGTCGFLDVLTQLRLILILIDGPGRLMARTGGSSDRRLVVVVVLLIMPREPSN